MGLRYRKRIKLLPGIHLNLSKSGVSTSVGKPGTTVNFSNRGTRVTTGIPGSGLSYSRTVRRKPTKAAYAHFERAMLNLQKELGLSDEETAWLSKQAMKNPKSFAKKSPEEIVRMLKRHRAHNSFWKRIGIAFCVLFVLFAIMKVLAP